MSFSNKYGMVLNSFKKAHQFIAEHKLWHFVFIPGILNVVLFLTFFIWLMNNVDGWIEFLFEWDCQDGTGWTNWFCELFSASLGVLKYAFGWLVKCVMIMLYLSIYKHLILIVYSPVIAYLVELVDQKNKGVEAAFSMEQFLKDTVRGIRIAVRNILLEGICVVVILAMTFIPLVNLLQPIMLWLVSAYFLGFSMMDYSLERKRLDTRNSIDFIKKNKSSAVGIGTVFQLMFLVPFIGWMFAPTYSAIAAYFTIEELEEKNSE